MVVAVLLPLKSIFPTGEHPDLGGDHRIRSGGVQIRPEDAGAVLPKWRHPPNDRSIQLERGARDVRHGALSYLMVVSGQHRCVIDTLKITTPTNSAATHFTNRQPPATTTPTPARSPVHRRPRRGQLVRRSPAHRRTRRTLARATFLPHGVRSTRSSPARRGLAWRPTHPKPAP